MMDDTAAEDWFTADFLEFADSLAGQAVTGLIGDDPDGERARFDTPSGPFDPPITPITPTPVTPEA